MQSRFEKRLFTSQLAIILVTEIAPCAAIYGWNVAIVYLDEVMSTEHRHGVGVLLLLLQQLLRQCLLMQQEALLLNNVWMDRKTCFNDWKFCMCTKFRVRKYAPPPKKRESFYHQPACRVPPPVGQMQAGSTYWAPAESSSLQSNASPCWLGFGVSCEPAEIKKCQREHLNITRYPCQLNNKINKFIRCSWNVFLELTFVNVCVCVGAAYT